MGNPPPPPKGSGKVAPATTQEAGAGGDSNPLSHPYPIITNQNGLHSEAQRCDGLKQL